MFCVSALKTQAHEEKLNLLLVLFRNLLHYHPDCAAYPVNRKKNITDMLPHDGRNIKRCVYRSKNEASEDGEMGKWLGNNLGLS